MPREINPKEASPAPRRMVARFEGHVQGVGFRYTTVHIAASFKVTGFVRNEPDGSVLVVAEGDEVELMRFHTHLRVSQLGRYIMSDKITWEPATGEYAGFRVAHSRYWS